jgi:hypothetical protein
MSIVATQRLRKRLQNLDIEQDVSDRQVYLECRARYIKAGEGVRHYVYDDISGKSGAEGSGQRTVGVGFNMSRPTARQEWDKIFEKTIDFEAVWCGKRALSSVEVDALLTGCLQQREQELRQCYGQDWQRFPANQRLALEDLWFCTPKLANQNSRVWQYLKAYGQTYDQIMLMRAVAEVRHRSNPTGHPGIQSRRESQATLLALED